MGGTVYQCIRINVCKWKRQLLINIRLGLLTLSWMNTLSWLFSQAAIFRGFSLYVINLAGRQYYGVPIELVNEPKKTGARNSAKPASCFIVTYFVLTISL